MPRFLQLHAPAAAASSSSSSRNSLLKPFIRQPHQNWIIPTEPLISRRRQFSRWNGFVKSPSEPNILALLRTDIDYHRQYAPPHQPVTKYNTFTVEDRPGEQWVTLRGKYGEEENIKIEATMFDCQVFVPKSGYKRSGEDLQLHINLLVDMWKTDEHELLEFVCSAWPDSLEIQKAYIFHRHNSPRGAYMGPNVKELKSMLRNGLYEFLRTRGVDDDLSLFLHEYMLNKDKAERIQWYGKVREFMER